MKSGLLCFIFICFLTFIGSSQVLNPVYIHSRNSLALSSNINWQRINLYDQIEWSYGTLTTDYPSATLIVSFNGVENLRYKTCKSQACTSWTIVKPDQHTDEGDKKALLFLDQSYDKIIFDFDQEHSTSSNINVALRYFTYTSNDKAITNISSRNCTCAPLTFKNRVQWNCPDTEQSSLFVPDYTKHTHIVIHHQAGSANPPYDNVVKAIWDYHVNGNGWSDIGYNWLIAPDGTIYKGRSWLNGDQNVRGAHTCACNSNKLGICLLGDLTNNLPTPAQYESLKNFIVWKACELDILPDTSSTIVSSKSGECIEEFVHHITGHKDNCGAGYTACPGDRFYPTLESLRQEVIQKFYNCFDTLNTANQDQHFTTKVEFFPNPNDGRFTINVFDKALLLIYNRIGQKVRRYELTNGKQNIDTGLAAGIYFLYLSNNSDNTKCKMVVR